MNISKRRARFALSFALTLLGIATATRLSEAATVYQVGQGATRIYSVAVSVTAGQLVTAETLNLSAGGDTVLHVQKLPDGTYLAGNDDYIGLASRVSFTPSFTGFAWFLVRAYSSLSYGSCTLRVTKQGSSTDYPVTFGGIKRAVGATSNAITQLVEEQGGASDTNFVLFDAARPHQALAFDDDDGVGLMAFSSYAGTWDTIVVGTYGGSHVTPQLTTLVVDDTHANDADFDGLGSGLEALLGTSPSTADTDHDGHTDGAEVLGYNTNPPVKLPFYGANPMVKDIFVEVDWYCPTAGTCVPDDLQMKAADAEAAAARWLAAGVTAHFDIGRSNTNPATWKTWGNWGGANEETENTYCKGLTPPRTNVFFHVLTAAGCCGGQFSPYDPTPCVKTSTDFVSMAHELGHFRLTHSGAVPANDQRDCNPFYMSVMNQAYYDGKTSPGGHSWYSDGSVQSVANATSISEQGWAGQPWLPKIANTPWSFPVDVAGGRVDWNRNGQFDAAPVQAAPTWSLSGDCDTTGFSRSELASGVGQPALAWLEDPALPSNGRLFLFGEHFVSGSTRYASVPSFQFVNCSSNPSRWTPCTTFSTWTQIPAAPWSQGGVAATDIGGGKLLLVYLDAYGKLHWQTVTWNFSNGTAAWSAQNYVSATWTSNTRPALVTDGSVARLFVGNQGTLAEWTFNIATSAWTGPTTQQWVNVAGNVAAGLGVGLTRGYRAGDVTSSIFAIIPNGQFDLQFARRTGAAQWYRYDSFWGAPQGQPKVGGAPGLAYVAPGGGAAGGRFYFAYPRTNRNSRIAFSEGNDESYLATSKRLQMRTDEIMVLNQWDAALQGTGMSLVFRPPYDTNLRLAYSRDPYYAPQTMFFPLADGIVNQTLRDWNDLQVIQNDLACGLFMCCDTPSACPSWL